MPTLRVGNRSFAPRLKPATPAQRLRTLLPTIACLVLLACSFTPVRSLSTGFPATATPKNSYVAVTGTTDLQVTSDPACSAGFADAHLGYFERARTEHAPVSGVICVKNISDRVTSWSMFASATTRPARRA